MENRKNIMFLIPALLSGFFITTTVFAYSPETHAYLTQEAAKIATTKVNSDLIPYLIDGSIQEDTAPRWMNHFYDPLHEKGLIFMGVWQVSKQWAQDSAHQNSGRYKVPATIASILSAIQKKKLSEISTESDFTWNKALFYWINGEKEKGMFALGHIVHLVEDLGVPDHTRNDAHPNGSPYEQWVKRYSLSSGDPNLKNISPKTFGSLDKYFDGLASFSNNNFYSQDTIGIQSGFPNPQPVDYEISGVLMYAIGVKGNKISVQPSKTSLFITSNAKDISIDNPKVLKDYWSLLSKETISYTAGVIDLFFKEAEANKNNPAFQKKENLVGQIIEAAKNTLANLFGKTTFNEGESIALNPTLESSPLPSIVFSPSPTPRPSYSPLQTPIPSVASERLRVVRVIDGDTIVLENNSIVRLIGINAPELSDDPSRSQCFALEAKKELEKLILNKYVTLEKSGTDKDQYGRLLRYVWVEETLINKALVENGSVYSYNFGKNHPQEDEFEALENKAKEKKSGLWGKECINETEEAKNEPTAGKICSFDSSGFPSHSVLINEIAWMGSVKDAADEWLELKNISSRSVSFEDWSLVNEGGTIQISLSSVGSLGTNGFALLERTDDTVIPFITADGIYKGTLKNSGERLRLFDSSCNLIDEVDAAANWPAGHSVERRTMERNLTGFDWHTSSIIGGTPKSQNSSPWYGGGAGGGGTSPSPSPSLSPSPSPSPSPSLSPTPTVQPEFIPVRINEVMYDLSGADSNREWIEVYNASATSTVSLVDWKLNENETNHSIAEFQGGSLLAPETYAVIADSPEDFLIDHPDFSGILLDSTFSLSNEGESLVLKNGSLVIDLLTYLPDWGGSGDTKSVQYFAEGWAEAIPTPGEENQRDPVPTPTPSLAPADHIVISEFQVEGPSADDDFIELYNPTLADISLDGYSIQYLSGGATSTDSISKKNLPEIIVPAQSFFLLANQDGSFAADADMMYSFGLSGFSVGAHIILSGSTSTIQSLEDAYIVDLVSYGEPVINSSSVLPMPEHGSSWERKTIVGDSCSSPLEDNEYMGNQCDQNSGDDFVARSNPRPQRGINLPEPRARSVVHNLNVENNPALLQFVISWEVSSMYPVGYATVTEIVGSSTPVIVSQTTATSTIYSYKEVGRDYQFSVYAQDSDGLSSESTVSESYSVPSFLSELYMYQAGEQYKLEGVYAQYPFIPDIHYRNPENSRWKLAAFFLNQEAGGPDIFWDDQWDVPGSLWISYDACVGGAGGGRRIVFPDTGFNCGSGGGAYNRSYSYSRLEDKGFSATTGTALVDGENYLTVAYYDYRGESGGHPTFQLVALDKTRFVVGSSPRRLSPSLTGSIETVFDESTSRLTFVWSLATDSDTYDELVYHYIQLNPGEEWIDRRRGSQYSISVSPGQSFEVSLYAQDDLGNRSEMLTTTWDYPGEERVMLLMGAPDLSFPDSSFGPLLSPELSPSSLLSPQPSPEPLVSPDSSPGPTPGVIPEFSPVPEVLLSPQITPEILPSPETIPFSSLEVTPEPSPTLELEILPSPEVTLEPSPLPEITPEPLLSPLPIPGVSPNPLLEPSETHSPEPSPHSASPDTF